MTGFNSGATVFTLSNFWQADLLVTKSHKLKRCVLSDMTFIEITIISDIIEF
jgi:hypothetical protein